jgi:hypothetical protein
LKDLLLVALRFFFLLVVLLSRFFMVLFGRLLVVLLSSRFFVVLFRRLLVVLLSSRFLVMLLCGFFVSVFFVDGFLSRFMVFYRGGVLRLLLNKTRAGSANINGGSLVGYDLLNTTKLGDDLRSPLLGVLFTTKTFVIIT